MNNFGGEYCTTEAAYLALHVPCWFHLASLSMQANGVQPLALFFATHSSDSYPHETNPTAFLLFPFNLFRELHFLEKHSNHCPSPGAQGQLGPTSKLPVGQRAVARGS